MVMAARAAVSKSKEYRSNRVGDVVQDFLAALDRIVHIELVRKVPIEAGGNSSGSVIGIKLVSGQLFLDKAVIWFVLIEGLDDVVAIAPDVRPVYVRPEAFAFGVPGKIEPVARKPLPIGRGGQQPVDYFLIGIRRCIGDELANVFRSGRQSGHVQTRAAKQRDLVSRGIQAQALTFEFGEYEGVDRIARRSTILDCRNRWFDNLLIGPVAALSFAKLSLRELRGGEHKENRERYP